MRKSVAIFAAVLAASFAFPLAHADVPGLGPYVGQWGAHGESLAVNPDGTGTETYNGGSVDFRMSTVQTEGQPNTAYGNITSGGKADVGSYVTMQLVDGGRGLLLGVANGDNNLPFCKRVNGGYANPADCGA